MNCQLLKLNTIIYKGCCENYSANNRRNKAVIKNMVIRNGFDEIIDNEIPEYIYE